MTFDYVCMHVVLYQSQDCVALDEMNAKLITSMVLLEKPRVTQLLKNFSTFYGTRRFITVFTNTQDNTNTE
jgi:hypothetical protein